MRGRADAYAGSPCGTTKDMPSAPPRRLSTTTTLSCSPTVAALATPGIDHPCTVTAAPIAAAPPRRARRDREKSLQPQSSWSELVMPSPGHVLWAVEECREHRSDAELAEVGHVVHDVAER